MHDEDSMAGQALGSRKLWGMIGVLAVLSAAVLLKNSVTGGKDYMSWKVDTYQVVERGSDPTGVMKLTFKRERDGHRLTVLVPPEGWPAAEPPNPNTYELWSIKSDFGTVSFWVRDAHLNASVIDLRKDRAGATFSPPPVHPDGF